MLVGLLVIAPLATSAPADSRQDQACRVRPHSKTRDGYWRSVRLPESDDALPASTSDSDLTVSVHPRSAERIYVSDGSVLWGTKNGGCDWDALWSIPEIPSASMPITSESVITSIAVGATKSGTMIYVALGSRIHADLVSPPTGLHVIVSDDEGRTWRLADNGLLPAGQYPTLRLFPADPSTAYLAIQVGVQSGDSDDSDWRTLFYRTRDGGRSWEARQDPMMRLRGNGTKEAGGPEPFWWDFSVSPDIGNHIWMWDHVQIVRSTDGAESWQKVKSLRSQSRKVDLSTGAYDLTLAEGGTIVISPSACFRGCESLAWISRDRGRTWAPQRTLGVMLALASIDNRNFLTLTPGGQTFIFRLGDDYGWRDVTPTLLASPYELIRSADGAVALITDETPSPLSVYLRLTSLELFIPRSTR